MIEFFGNLVDPSGAVDRVLEYDAVNHVVTVSGSRVSLTATQLVIDAAVAIEVVGADVAVDFATEGTADMGEARLELFRRELGFSEWIGTVFKSGVISARSFTEQAPPASDDLLELFAEKLAFSKNGVYVSSLSEL